jgi:type IV secretory pathway TraG/TraD family ATPase VirD4
MTKRGKLVLGVVCGLAGVALIMWNGAAIALSLTQAKTGIPLLNLAGCVGGLFGLGAAADLLGPPQKSKAPKTPIAESRFASRADIEAAGLSDRAGDDEGIYLGTFTDDNGTIALRWRGETNLVTWGKPGANKSTGYIAPNLSLLRRSAIVMNPKLRLGP